VAEDTQRHPAPPDAGESADERHRRQTSVGNRALNILAGPVNFANQAMVRTRALQARGHDAHHVLYAWGGVTRYGFDTDRVVVMKRDNWLPVQLSVLNEALEQGTELFELRYRSLIHPPGAFSFFSGLDVPYIKGSGAKIVYGFTGYDLRRRSMEMKLNRYSPWHYGLELPYDEEQQKRYLDYLRQWVDRFVVTDPEMQAYVPEAEILPRAVDLSKLEFVGVDSGNNRPLIVHAPTDRMMKGSDHVIAAVEELKREGLSFEFKLIEKMDQIEAATWYRRADVVVDQLRIGWYGVVAVEAMALGKPVIAYILDEHYERFTPRLPIANANPETVKHMLTELIRDAELRSDLSRRSREFAEQVHDINKVVCDLEGLYLQVLNAPDRSCARAPQFLTVTANQPLDDWAKAQKWDRQMPELARKARLYEQSLIEADPQPAPPELGPPVPDIGGRGDAGERVGLEICILSRKDLSRITRVIRQARALIDAGHRVTIVCLKRSADELVVTVPEVEWVELELEAWTRQRLVRAHERRRLRNRKRGLRLKAASGARQKLISAQFRFGDALRAAVRMMVLLLPGSVLLRRRGQSPRDRYRELRALNPIQLMAEAMKPWGQRANTISFAEKACQALAGRRFDICQAHDNYALLAARRLARQSDARLLYDAVEISEHRNMILSIPRMSPLERASERFERWEETRIFKHHAAGMVTIGDGLADWYSKRYRIKRPVVVRNCRQYWEYQRRDDIRRDCRLPHRCSLVVWFGYAYPEQGIETIIEAARYVPRGVQFAVLADTIPRWEKFYASLRERAKEVGVDRIVHFLPARQPNELISYVSGAQLGIIPRPNAGPNVYYSMPNKFMEMVMARLPVAVSQLADMEHLITKYKIGRIFDVADPEDVARTLVEMLEPETYGALRTAIGDAAKVLCWENEAQSYLGLVNEIAPEPERRARVLSPDRVRRPHQTAALERLPTTTLGSTPRSGEIADPEAANISREELETLRKELVTLRQKERELDRLAVDLPKLRYQAKRTEELIAEVKSLRYKSSRYDELSKEVMHLRYQVKKLKPHKRTRA
jgi:glycosyltransferase involved in cell wall biosynthesis